MGKGRRAPILVETLENRTFLSAGPCGAAEVNPPYIDGVVFKDLNADGVQQSAETGVAAVTVYIDRNDNRKPDAGEKAVVTDLAGHYRITYHSGKWIVRQVLPKGWHQTTPIGNLGQHVWLAEHTHAHNRDFGQTRNAQLWSNFGGDAQHTAVSDTPSQSLKKIHWRTTIDLDPQKADAGELLTHYGSILVTPKNTIILPVKTNADGSFRIEARSGADGKLLWSATTDWKAPPHIEFPMYQAALTRSGRLYFAGAGGTIYYRDNVDQPGNQPIHQLAYYGLDQYKAHMADLDADVAVNTPITVDGRGNIFFGVQVSSLDVPFGLQGGIVRIGADGKSKFVAATHAASDPSIGDVAQQSAVALSNDGKRLYVAVDKFLPVGVGAGIRSSNYLLALDSFTLKTVAVAKLTDPASGEDLKISNGGTSSPMVGPDGDVYFGVVEQPFNSHHNRGWLLHFSRDLSQQKITGGFGWDDTPSIVPASMVRSYHGTSTYLLMTKYNRYEGFGDDGVNKIAILDPDAPQKDQITGIPIMKEVLTIAGQTKEQIPGKPNAVREWCINTAVVDPATDSVLANSEDGKLYRWNLATNTLSEKITLTAGLGEAYTPTAVGSDGAVYAINDAILFAVGE